MSTPVKILLTIVALFVVLAAAAPSEAAAYAMGEAFGPLLLLCGIGYLVVRRAQ